MAEGHASQICRRYLLNTRLQIENGIIQQKLFEALFMPFYVSCDVSISVTVYKICVTEMCMTLIVIFRMGQGRM